MHVADVHREPGLERRRAGRRAREPWVLRVIDWLLPWPALIVWLMVASRYADGWIGVGFAYAAIALAAWRGLRALPAEGLNEARQ